MRHNSSRASTLHRKPSIGIQPYPDTQSNAYSERMTSILSRIGGVDPFPSPRDLACRPYKFFRRRFDVVYLSWVEQTAFHPHTGKILLLRRLLLFAYLLVSKMASRKVVWIKHNNYPHHVTDESVKALAVSLMDNIESFVDVVITHSPLESRGKRQYVPHPLYAFDNLEEKTLHFDEYFLIFGCIAPYKRVADAIQLLPDQLNLVVAGVAKDSDYLQQCQQLAAGKQNVLIKPGFIDSAEAARMASDAHGLLVLNADADMVVSGNYMYALSIGATLYALKTPFLEWLAATPGIRGIHHFDSLESLLSEIGREKTERLSADPVVVQSLFGDAVILEHIKSAIHG